MAAGGRVSGSWVMDRECYDDAPCGECELCEFRGEAEQGETLARERELDRRIRELEEE